MAKKITVGYVENFLGDNHKIKLPVLSASQKKDVVTFDGGNTKLDYIHYSVVMCKSRRFAYFTAVNIDGSQWQDNPRIDGWKNDTRIKADEQWGSSLYTAKKSNFDKGHLVRREDPEWGEKNLSLEAGKKTFYFPNCTPQHSDLNKKIWAELEAAILHNGADENNLKATVFTGPVLTKTDGTFVTKVKSTEVKIPNLFWKIVVWTKSNGKAYAVGFIMSQEKFLVRDGIILKKATPVAARLAAADEDVFEHIKFKDGKTYQVKIEEIENLTGLKFKWNVVKPYKKATPNAISATPKKKPKAKPTALAIRFSAINKIENKLKLKLKGLVL